MTDGRGRPSLYQPLLNAIRRVGDGQWHPVREGHANRTAPSSLRQRYSDFDFRAIPDGHGEYTIEARYVGD